MERAPQAFWTASIAKPLRCPPTEDLREFWSKGLCVGTNGFRVKELARGLRLCSVHLPHRNVCHGLLSPSDLEKSLGLALVEGSRNPQGLRVQVSVEGSRKIVVALHHATSFRVPGTPKFTFPNNTFFGAGGAKGPVALRQTQRQRRET